MDFKTGTLLSVLLFSFSLPVGSPGWLGYCSCSKIDVTQ